VFGRDAYPDLHVKAAALLHSLARNHALVDANMRLAWTACRTFLAIDGQWIIAGRRTLRLCDPGRNRRSARSRHDCRATTRLELSGGLSRWIPAGGSRECRRSNSLSAPGSPPPSPTPSRNCLRANRVASFPVANRSLSFRCRPRLFSLVGTASSIKQAQQPPVIAKREPHQGIWVVDLGAQPRQPHRSCRRVCRHVTSVGTTPTRESAATMPQTRCARPGPSSATCSTADNPLSAVKRVTA
jgi:hypothetical protein